MARTSQLTAESTATSLNKDFYLKNFYSANRKAFKVSTRSDYNKTELSYEDSRALKKAVNKLMSFDFTEEENGDNMVSSIEAFVDTYNNTISSTGSEDSDAYRYNKQLQKLTKEYEDEFKDLGITIEKDGSLTVNENLLKKSKHEEVRKIFHKESEYINRTRSIAKRMHTTTYDEIYEQMTGCGGRLNIIL